MGYNTVNTQWPAAASSPAVQSLIDTLFNTLDNPSPDAGDRLVENIFSADGQLKLGGKWLVGSDALRKSRENVWTNVISRRHVANKVYISQPDSYEDLVVLGTNTVQVRNGNTVSFDFVARITLDDASSQKPRVRSCESWADSAPVKAALQAS
ncbi:hypothetical protein N7523_011153 [Penicillium sp. IBT 18751x]|nr:hypothetical protein N7523_011153 [Penicillium sp. IBT 18751x]